MARKKNTGQRKISEMKKSGKVLLSSLSSMPELTLSSWRDERLPNMLWASLIICGTDRASYLRAFRKISEICANLSSNKWVGLGHTNLASLSDYEFDELMIPLIEGGLVSNLKPLNLFKSLPDFAHWGRIVPDWNSVSEDDYSIISHAIGLTSWHQSEASTDIRWLKILSMILGGKLHYPESLGRQLEEIIGFPNVGDMRSVRPSIRAAEQTFAIMEDDQERKRLSKWIDEFWGQCKKETNCIQFYQKESKKVNTKEVFNQAVCIYDEVRAHFFKQNSFAAVDARIDAVFGLTMFSINILLSMVAGVAYRRVEGRMMLRSLAECLITLGYLMHVDAEKTWIQYRNYGNGQAKLAYLKTIDFDVSEMPKYVSLEDLEQLANEDKWQEFSDIDLGSWSKKNIREMSDISGLKNVYDRYFGWASGFVHGHWVAVRDSVFDLCMNPLHRLHRIPAIP